MVCYRTPKNKKHAHMGVFLVFGGCKLSSDALNTRDATRCHVSGVRYMGEWYWLRGGKIGSEQERRAECVHLSCPAGGGVVVFGGCELSSDAPNTRDATRCRVSGVRYMGEWYWLRGGEIGSEQGRRTECARLSCLAGGGMC